MRFGIRQIGDDSFRMASRNQCVTQRIANDLRIGTDVQKIVVNRQPYAPDVAEVSYLVGMPVAIAVPQGYQTTGAEAAIQQRGINIALRRDGQSAQIGKVVRENGCAESGGQNQSTIVRVAAR